jgi:hypothetical protein
MDVEILGLLRLVKPGDFGLLYVHHSIGSDGVSPMFAGNTPVVPLAHLYRVCDLVAGLLDGAASRGRKPLSRPLSARRSVTR